ncbi:peptidase s24-like domain-containing protein [Ditylenchus destructor]|uniref:Peptidase s24-like domain-containing protein n=1 Tax=Ditylenchus destructor TaxID=166010 RepID=A0AAD4R7S5_9BILA|nr:peptidase s24-like domain-containing protein [Ditylenchus destructor]
MPVVFSKYYSRLSAVAKVTLMGIGGVMIVRYFGGFIYCKNDSMVPTIQPGDLLYAMRISNSMRSVLLRGDLVVVKDSAGSKALCRRILFKPEDQFWDNNGVLNWVPPDHYYVVSDNLDDTADSRTFGPVPKEWLKYQLVLRIWPWNRKGWIVDFEKIRNAHKKPNSSETTVSEAMATN